MVLVSAFEWETQLNVAFSKSYTSDEKYKELEQKLKQIQKMISSIEI